MINGFHFIFGGRFYLKKKKKSGSGFGEVKFLVHSDSGFLFLSVLKENKVWFCRV